MPERQSYTEKTAASMFDRQLLDLELQTAAQSWSEVSAMSFFHHLRCGLLLLSFLASCQSSSLDQKEMEVLEKMTAEIEL
ncbi:hypothetical protein AK812_SmicGene5809 [Symbiodinium microadriaticum]|uniref:Uncharacterized protein n=1 Tax=Symbiodinium microadriaticum TaxID=2951 RepID=A0A1Q9EST3_SYMMI|nr:hypothetical protein AK812_SmicGene5809 [Symbiodinium microadriaticum]